MHQVGEARLKRRTKEAIALAMQGRWEEAVIANRSIIEVFPKDIDAFNRLGKALTELGQYAEAREAYSRALEIDPRNSIARRNLQRLSMLKEGQARPKGSRHGVIPHLFIEEMGKGAVAGLYQLASREVLARTTAGDPVNLKYKGQGVIVENNHGEYLGHVEPKIGTRLAKLMKGGNQYTAAIASIGDGEAKIIIKEVFQHPSQAGRPSFPPKGADGFRSYVKGSILKYEIDEDGALDDTSYHLEWEDEAELPAEDASLAASDEPEDFLEE